jgi:small subunit ribosomal protein SAe
MSGGFDPFALKEEDAMKFLASQTHIGTTNVDHQMHQYVYKRRVDGTYIINLRKTWQKLQLAARAIAAVENPADVIVVSARPFAHRALMKFAAHTGATPIFGRFAPGALTNQIQKNFKEPRVIVISDPRVDHQVVTEASYANVPVISFANTDSPLKLVDIAIPCNNKGAQSVGLLWWFLAREVLTIKGKISRQTGFILEDKEIMPDLYFYRDPAEQEKEEAQQIEATDATTQEYVTAAEPGAIDFNAQPEIKDWAAETAAESWAQGSGNQDWNNGTNQW